MRVLLSFSCPANETWARLVAGSAPVPAAVTPAFQQARLLPARGRT